MNKKLLLALVPVMLLAGCNKTKEDYQLDLKVISPAGSPAIALYKYLKSDNYEVNGDANNVTAYFSTNDKDVIVAPTNAGIAAINKGANFKIVATVTFGNFFLLSTGKDSDNVLNEGDKVIAFQQNGVAGKLFNYIYGDKSLDVTYLGTAADVKNKVLSEDVDAGYVMLAQPVVNAVLKAKTEYKLFANMQDDYKTKTGGKEITQASVFVNNGVDKEKTKSFLSNLEKDIKALLDNPDVFLSAVEGMDDVILTSKISAQKEAVVNLLKNNNALGIGYKNALSNKAAIDAFIGTLGLAETNEEIYFNVNK